MNFDSSVQVLKSLVCSLGKIYVAMTVVGLAIHSSHSFVMYIAIQLAYKLKKQNPIYPDLGKIKVTP